MVTVAIIGIFILSIIDTTVAGRYDTSSYPLYDSVWDAKEGYTGIYNDGKIEITDSSQKIVLQLESAQLQKLEFHKGVSVFKEEEKYGLIDINGKVVIPFIYDSLKKISYTEFYLAENNGKQGIINSKGEIIVQFIYDELTNISTYTYTDKYLTASLREKTGVIDFLGNVLLPFEYDSIKICSDNTVTVEKDGQFALVNLKGEIILPYNDYDYMPIKNGFVQKGNFEDDYRVNQIFDETGKLITKQGEYSFYGSKNGEFITVESNTDFLIGLIDNRGNLVQRPAYNHMDYIDDNIYKVRLKDEWGIWTKDKLIHLERGLTNVIEYDKKGYIYGVNKNSREVFIFSDKGKVLYIFRGDNIQTCNENIIIHNPDNKTGSIIIPKSDLI